MINHAIQNRIHREHIKRIVIITIVFLLIHGFELILTGTFHDDWLSYFHDYATKNMEGMESGRPYYSFVIEMVWLLPGYSYRILGFLTYYAVSLLLYRICSKLEFIGEQAAFFIALIYISIPCNDARVLLANYPYALGLLLFFLAVNILISHENHLTTPFRMISLLLFFLSFTLQSNLAMYAIVILFLLFKKRLQLVKYIDYCILPVLFYGLNSWLFPTYGAYENYNTFAFDDVVTTIKLMPNTIIQTMNSLVNNWGRYWLVNWLCIALVWA